MLFLLPFETKGQLQLRRMFSRFFGIMDNCYLHMDRNKCHKELNKKYYIHTDVIPIPICWFIYFFPNEQILCQSSADFSRHQWLRADPPISDILSCKMLVIKSIFLLEAFEIMSKVLRKVWPCDSSIKQDDATLARNKNWST